MEVEGADIDARDDGVMDTRMARRVAGNVIVDNESPFLLSFFLLSNPSVNEDFALQPAVTAALTAVCTRFSASNE